MRGVAGMRGVVASGNARVTEVVADVLRDGGNAFDAVVAGGFASAVAEPALTSLGGGGFLLARTADGRAVLFDFFVDTPGRGLSAGDLEPHFLPITVHFPGSDQVFNTGLGSVAVPGNLRGLLHVHRRLGRLPLAEVVAPAARLAREGLPLEARQAYFLELLRPIMTLTAEGRRLFEPEGRYLCEGSPFANPELAELLESLPTEGDHDFYEGALAKRMARDMRAGRGLLSEADLAAYRVIEREPLATSYRGHQVLTNPPPSFGGGLIALSLRLLESHDVRSLGFGSGAHLSLLASVMVEVDRCRAAGGLGPDGVPDTALRESLRRLRRASNGTTHLSVWDAAGNAASMTTSNGEGSGYLVPGTGIMLNNMMGEDDLHPDGFHASPPGLRVASMMAPTVLLRGDRVQLVVGSGGSKRIRTTLLQIISDVVDFGLSARDAVDAPRLHWDGECLQVEPGFDATAIGTLRRSWSVNLWSVQDVYFGGAHVVQPTCRAAGDRRRGGAAARVE